MKVSKYSQVSIQSLLRRVSALDVFKALGANDDSVIESKDSIRSRCFLHNDADAFSLTSEKDTHSTYCLDLSCRLSRLNDGGGNYFETYAYIKGISYDEALEYWARQANVTLELRSEEETASQRDISYFNYIEVARFELEDIAEGGERTYKPLQIVFEGKETLGRGLIVQQSRLPDLLEKYPTNIYRSQFLYELNDKDAIIEEALRGELYLLGNYYLIFDATSSAAIVHAINQATELVEKLHAEYDVPFEAVSIYYSDRPIKVEIDYTVFGVVPRQKLDKVFYEMTRILIGNEEEREKRYSQLSLKCYTYDFLTAVPGSRTSTRGRDVYKIRLPYHIFKKTSYQRLHELSQKKPELAPKEMVDRVSPKARELFERAVRIVQGEGVEEERETIATMFYRDLERPDHLASADTLAKTLLKRLFSENRQILATPSAYFNSLLGGGFYPGSLYLFAGFPGTGITSFSLWLLLKIAEQYKAPCLYVSLQVGIEELFKRSISMIGRIGLHEISKKRMVPSELYTDTDFYKKVFSAYEKFQEIAKNVTFLEGIKMANTGQIRRAISELKERTQGQNGRGNVFVVIDSLQLLLAQMRALGEGIIGGYDIQALTGVLKSIARELDVTIYVTSEFYGDYSFHSALKRAENVELMSLYENTQFVDCVGVLSSIGCCLGPLISFFEGYRGTLNEDEAKKTVSILKKVEADFKASDVGKRQNSVFTIVDIIKNRGGLTGKALFIYHRSYADFEPVEYPMLSENGG